MSGPQLIVFRVAASPKIGMGHLMRTRTFAAHLKAAGHRCFMIGPAASYRNGADNSLFDEWEPRDEWSDGEAEADIVIDMARSVGARRIVLDDYRVDPPFESALADERLIFMQQFDASRPRPYLADMIVNGGPAERRNDYLPFLRDETVETLFGPTYAVLRPQFPPSSQRPAGRPVENVFVAFGGGDDLGAIRFTLEALLSETPDTLRFAVMSGAGNPNNAGLESWIAANAGRRVVLHVDPAYVAGLMAACDLAVLGGGTSTFEAASAGLPMILLALADNQMRQCGGWRDLGAAIFLGRHPQVATGDLVAAFNALYTDSGRRAAMTETGRKAVDGRGVERLTAHLLKDRQK